MVYCYIAQKLNFCKKKTFYPATKGTLTFEKSSVNYEPQTCRNCNFYDSNFFYPAHNFLSDFFGMQ